jgi:hypothetical protein
MSFLLLCSFDDNDKKGTERERELSCYILSLRSNNNNLASHVGFSLGNGNAIASKPLGENIKHVDK